jgi:hypothetical protein
MVIFVIECILHAGCIVKVRVVVKNFVMAFALP